MKQWFGTDDHAKIAVQILNKGMKLFFVELTPSGEVQVSEKERKDDTGKLFKDVATLIVEKLASIIR